MFGLGRKVLYFNYCVKDPDLERLVTDLWDGLGRPLMFLARDGTKGSSVDSGRKGGNQLRIRMSGTLYPFEQGLSPEEVNEKRDGLYKKGV